jgi:hypothetical protein
MIGFEQIEFSGHTGNEDDYGYEAMHLMRKGQIRWLPQGDMVGQRRLIHMLFGIAT